MMVSDSVTRCKMGIGRRTRCHSRTWTVQPIRVFLTISRRQAAMSKTKNSQMTSYRRSLVGFQEL